MADGGTIFLDEISEVSQTTQAKLLRVLQEKEVRRLGDDRIITVDVRVIAATNRNLQKQVGELKFRSDLYYRISVLLLRMPPLRERKNDIRLLLEEFLNFYSLTLEREKTGYGTGLLRAYPEIRLARKCQGIEKFCRAYGHRV